VGRGRGKKQWAQLLRRRRGMKEDGRGISEYEGENFDDETKYSILKEVSKVRDFGCCSEPFYARHTTALRPRTYFE
jgi:hypothetical protein